MRELAARREADRARAFGKGPGKGGRAAGGVGADARAKPARGRQGVSKVSAKSWRSTMTRCAMGLGNKACSIRRSPTSGEGGIRTRGPAGGETPLPAEGGAESGARGTHSPPAGVPAALAEVWPNLPEEARRAILALAAAGHPVGRGK